MTQAMLIDDDEDYRNLLVRKLGRAYDGLVVHEIDPLTMDMPGEDYPWDDIDFIILDYQLGVDITGLDWFKRFKPEHMPATILLTARGSEELAVRAIKLGVDDYVVKEHFDNDMLIEAISESVYNKKRERAKAQDLAKQGSVFNKSSFIKRIESIGSIQERDNHLLVLKPESYRDVGTEKGLAAQDNYIRYIAERIYRYFSSHHIDCNIFIYREEYIAVILETKTFKKYVNDLYKKLKSDIFEVDTKKYPCSVNIGTISPGGLEPNEFGKSDFELISIAQALCDYAGTGNKKKKKICDYGDVNLTETGYVSEDRSETYGKLSFDIEKAISDGRVTANYQPWVYISTDETVNLKDIYDARIELLDVRGNKIEQRDLLTLLDNTFARRVVDRWVLRHTVSQLRELAENSGKYGNIKLAVKVTLSSVTDPEFIYWLKELLDEADPPPGCLLFEIEASQLLRDPEEHLKLFEAISDDYDIRYILSGIYQINTYYKVRDIYRFNYVKLNVKDLIYGFPRNPLYELINDIKKEEASIVAVNVDDAEVLTLATEFDIDYVHGYLVGRPYIDLISDSEGDLYCVI